MIDEKKLIERLEDCDDDCGCGVMRVYEAVDIVTKLAEEYNNGWIPCEKELPPHSDDLLLIQCSGKPRSNIVLEDAFCLASYTGEGWILEMWPEWKEADVTAWQPLPESYKPTAEQPDSISAAWKQQTMSRFERVE